MNIFALEDDATLDAKLQKHEHFGTFMGNIAHRTPREIFLQATQNIGPGGGVFQPQSADHINAFQKIVPKDTEPDRDFNEKWDNMNAASMKLPIYDFNGDAPNLDPITASKIPPAPSTTLPPTQPKPLDKDPGSNPFATLPVNQGTQTAQSSKSSSFDLSAWVIAFAVLLGILYTRKE